mmetsp:Transcript_24112/g.71470  ORF Transcript_24112/g.71470 Transcript_24112/m.71470 type:complete len:244 (-) Transcript_24112:337-1068(-)
MRASHASADDDVEALDRLAVRLHDDHRAHVVDVQVDRVVARHRHGHLELFRQVGAAVDRLDRVAGDDAVAVVVVAHLVEVKVRDVLLPVLDARSLFAIEPDLVEGLGHRPEEVGDRLRVRLRRHVRRVVREADRRHHDVPVDVSASAVRVGAHVGDGGDDGLEVALEDAVELEGLPRRGAQVALPVLVGQLVELPVELAGHLSARHLEPQHELVRLVAVGLLLEVAVLLHVRAVVLEDVDRVL